MNFQKLYFQKKKEPQWIPFLNVNKTHLLEGKFSYLYSVAFTALTMRSTFGKASLMSVGENANGVSVWVTRCTGASR